MRTLSAIAFLVIFSVPFRSSSQPDLSQDEVEELKALKNELKGTYQVQVLGTQEEPTLLLSLYDTIASKRKEEEVVYHKVRDDLRIKILPRKRIEAPDFKGVEQRIVHLEGSDDQE